MVLSLKVSVLLVPLVAAVKADRLLLTTMMACEELAAHASAAAAISRTEKREAVMGSPRSWKGLTETIVRFHDGDASPAFPA
jgi:hypothetical protein